MKVTIQLDDSLQENEVIIRCRELDDSVTALQKKISEHDGKLRLSFFKDNTEFFISLDQVLFFETSGSVIDAHTADDIFQIKLRLYELEDVLPHNFIRVSKSTIINTSKIYSIEKNITSSSLVKFEGSHKQVYVSRSYYKSFKQRLDENFQKGR